MRTGPLFCNQLWPPWAGKEETLQWTESPVSASENRGREGVERGRAQAVLLGQDTHPQTQEPGGLQALGLREWDATETARHSPPSAFIPASAEPA